MNDGWIKLHRKMREWQHYQNPSARMVFEDLLFAANSKTRFWHGHEINRGETMISISSLEYNTGLSRKTVIKTLKLLEKTGEIKRVKFAGAIKTIISNFDNYQGDSVTNGVPSSGIITPVTTLPSTPPGILPSTPLSTPPGTPEQEYKEVEEVEEYKEVKNNISPSNEGVSGDQSPDPESPPSVSVDFVGLIKFFNRTMSEANAIIPHVVSVKGKREGNVKARIREYGIDKVYEMITKASQSDFLNGKNKRGWRADFSWLFLPTNFQKVLEGNYDNDNSNGISNNYKSDREIEREKLASGYAATIARRLNESKKSDEPLW